MPKSAFLILVTFVMSSISACHINANIHSNARSLDTAKTPIIIAHRGASGFLPEHSKEAAVLAFMQGADYIEQDLVVTKDDHLVVLHDIHLETVTNVENIYPERARKDGRFYAIDFTLKELRQLSLHERQTSEHKLVFPNRYGGEAHYSITTFAEHVELIRELNRQFSKNTGWYPEIKSPQWHAQEGKDIAKMLVAELDRLSLNTKSANIFVQSFEPGSLQRLKNELKVNVKLIQLIADNSWKESDADYLAMLTPQGLQEIAMYADGIGPWFPQVYDYDKNEIGDLINSAHSLGLLVHPYTHREDAQGLPDKPKTMFEALKKAEVDGLFTDQIMPYMIRH